LDIGCGNGELLGYLKQNRNIDGRGIEISQKKVSEALMNGLSVIQGDAENDLSYYPDKSFDYAILSHTIQATQKPHEILQEMLRVAKYAIVSLPNFAHIKNRLHLLFQGSMPVNKTIPYDWYETPNIHFCSIRDFEKLCTKLNLEIQREIFLTNKYRFKGIFNNKLLANLFAEYGIFAIVKNELGTIPEAELTAEAQMVFKQKVSPQFV
jgi:methionine biosynthesis protein MetW